MPAGAAAGPAPQPRLTERHVLALGLALSGTFVAAAAAAAIWSVLGGTSTWAPLHLALAGAATVAIGTFMPHFAITLAGTRPSPALQRVASLLSLAIGSASVVLGVTLVHATWAAAGSGLVVLGLVGVALHTIAPLREPLARRHHVVTAAYGTALAELTAGVILGGMGAAGAAGVTARWALMRPAHAWLTLFGGISLTIFATLVYLGPTVLGARIRASRSLVVAVLGIGLGPILATSGFALDNRPAVLSGVALTAIGSVGQIGYMIDCWRRRGPFTSEHDWRRVVVGHVVAGPFWLTASVVVAFGDLVAGRELSGWSMGLLALPMVTGWMLQELVGSWTHLVPSVTPGGAAAHARQRRVLAVASRSRLVAWNLGVGLLWVGLASGASVLSVAGGAILGVSLCLSVVLLARSLIAAAY